MFDPNPFQNKPQQQSHQAMPTTHSSQPIVNGTSVLGLKYKDGVVMAADTLGSYGALAMFKSVQRLRRVGNHTMLGGGGEYSDFQAIMDILDDTVVGEREEGDGSCLYPNEIYSMLGNIMYGRRNKMDPLYNQLVVGGFRDGKSFLGYVDLHGSNYVDDHVATGYGAYIARPLLRKHYKPDMTKEQAMEVLEMCMTVLYYRDKCSINKIQFSVANADGIDILPPRELVTSWENMEKASNARVQEVVHITKPLRK